MDNITVQIASIPERVASLKLTINSLLTQSHIINVMLNGHSDEQFEDLYSSYALTYGVRFHRRANQMTDGEKYFNIENARPGYIFTCDDDLVYDADYCSYMIDKIEQYGRRAVLSLHGRVWPGLPIASFYRDRKEGVNIPGGGAFQCLSNVAGDHIIQGPGVYGCVGDGVAAWHTDTLRMSYDYVHAPNMSQLWLALACNKFGVPQIVAAHMEGFVQQVWDGPGIWDAENYNDGAQTNFINQMWNINTKYNEIIT